MIDLGAGAWVLLGVAAVVIGLSKTAVPASGTIAVAIFAAVLPARQSTGTILLLLILADMIALIAYRRDVNWRALVRLAPAVGVGILLGVAFLAVADDTAVTRVIGVILLVVVAFTLLRRRFGSAAASGRAPRVAAAAYGTLGGFATMVANAAGPVMSMYFLAARMPVKEFLGTAAWFFAIVNISKVPFSVGLGLITPEGLLLDLVLAPIVVAAAIFGRWLAPRLSQRLFERLVVAATLFGALYLLFA
ncbi:sulfite exporter TauE/SafE family protein [Microbacterium aurantiacum]|uniref:Probable membrane transporter protein n=1 Tax=Microbacterium aurantiacum TaxID=162393 RepID=A0AAJ2HCL8_9MICO|nr:sulfite exporter TauE/SafE family protein [Microbacterium aurantiacum]MDN4464909.1 sulfite exporter TauE/SafE family protein [Microbacterium aurantiacum]MDS0245115.1 sulfite exporter TauE/SafE family protein [Microbacterium aurantiacum]